MSACTFQTISSSALRLYRPVPCKKRKEGENKLENTPKVTILRTRKIPCLVFPCFKQWIAIRVIEDVFDGLSDKAAAAGNENDFRHCLMRVYIVGLIEWCRRSVVVGVKSKHRS